MEIYTAKSNAYFKKHPVKYVNEDGDSLLEELYWCYSQCNPINGVELRNQYKKVYQLMPELPDEKMDAILDEISMLCVMHESAGFQAGIRVGTRLAVELLE